METRRRKGKTEQWKNEKTEEWENGRIDKAFKYTLDFSIVGRKNI